MKIVGLTGGIGCGKSTVSKMFLDSNIPVIDTDRITKKIYTSLSWQKKLNERFDNRLITNGEFDKQKLREIVFNNKEELEKLDSILVPFILEHVSQALATVDNNIVIIDSPLLFSTGLNQLCSETIVVDIDMDIRIERIKRRNGYSEDFILQIVSNQIPQETMINKATYVIDNSKDLESTKEQFREVLKSLKKLSLEDTQVNKPLVSSLRDLQFGDVLRTCSASENLVVYDNKYLIRNRKNNDLFELSDAYNEDLTPKLFYCPIRQIIRNGKVVWEGKE